jgi:cobalt-zinc-cadmium efflux system membrane fusion protein
VVLDEAMMHNVTVAALSEKSLPRLLTATGKVQFNEDQMARILAPVSGQVQQLRVKVGDPVHKGDILFVIHSREVAAALDEYFDSRKDLDLAEKTYTMNRDLFAHQAASRIALQQAESELAKAKARVTRTVESLRALGVDIGDKEPAEGISAHVAVRTPISGTVLERAVTEGQFVQPDNNALLTISDLSTVWVLADIFERDLHLVTVGQKAELTTSAYPEQRFVAHVARVSDVVDPATRTVKVRFLAANPDGHLKPEMFASVALFLNESAPALTIPPAAVFTEGGRSFVYVRLGEREFARRPLEVEPDAGSLKVISGLQAGEQVVSDGALLVRLEENRQGIN